MGLSDIFRKPQIAPGETRINLSDEGIEINGKKFFMPVSINILEELFGKAKCYQLGNFAPTFFPRAVREKRMPHITGYTWDKHGIYCYAKDAYSVFSIGFLLNHGEPDTNNTPKKEYSGLLNINGNHWYESIKSGDSMFLGDEENQAEAYRIVTLGRYSVISEFTEITEEITERDSYGYSTVEFRPDDIPEDI